MGVSRETGAIMLILWMTLFLHEQCVSQEFWNDPAVNTVCFGTGGNDKAFFTLGQKLLQTINTHVGNTFTRSGGLDRGGPYIGQKWTPEIAGTVEMYAVKRKNSDHFLNGWLFLKMRSGNKGNLHRELYGQIEDENGNAVGEFYNINFCSDKEPLAAPKPLADEYFAPCGQVAPSATKVSNAMFSVFWTLIVNAEEKQVLKEHHNSVLTAYGPDVIFKFSHTSCNKPQKIRLRMYTRVVPADLKDDGQHTYGTLRTDWMRVNWTGAADILHVGERASCEALLVTKATETTTRGDVSSIPWIESLEPSIPYNDITTRQDIYKTKKFCKAVRVQLDDTLDVSNIPSFAGRCEKHDDYKVSYNTKHECTAGATANPSFMMYSEYLKKRMNCMKISRCPCHCKPKLAVYQLGIKDEFCSGFLAPSNPASPPGVPPPPKQLGRGYSTEAKAGKSIMEHRKLHGIVMLVVTLNLVPISMTLSRYFKETWVQKAHLQVLHVWYLVHVVLAIISMGLYAVGSIAIMRSVKVMGRSLVKFSTYHKLLGTGTILLFGATVLIGSFRHVENSAFRKIIMITHALVGFIYYFLGILTAITSSWIPGSPSSDDTECINSPKFMEKSTWTFMPYLAGWVGLDFIFHILFTILQCVADKSSEYKRPMYFPIVPILKGGETKDTKGKTFRVLLLIIYCGINVGITVMLTLKIINNSKAGCGFGPTTCIYSDVDTPLGKDICGI